VPVVTICFCTLQTFVGLHIFKVFVNSKTCKNEIVVGLKFTSDLSFYRDSQGLYQNSLHRHHNQNLEKQHGIEDQVFQGEEKQMLLDLSNYQQS
jgi:hypothetical protein